jgi:hypothetical protein
MRALKATLSLAVVLGVGTAHAQAMPSGTSGGSGLGSDQGSSFQQGGQGAQGTQGGPSGQGSPGGQDGQDGEGGPEGPGGQGGPEGPGGQGGPDGSASPGGPGGSDGAGGPGGGPGSPEPEHAGERSAGDSETALWLVLLVLLVTCILGWKRVGEWGRARLDPAVDQLHRAARRLDARSRSVQLRIWSPSSACQDFGLVLGQPLVQVGKISVLATAEPEHAERAVVDLLQVPGSAVALISDQTNSERIGTLLGERASSAIGRILLTSDAECLGDGLGSLIGSLETAGDPISAVMDLRGDLGGADPLGSLPALAEMLRPWAERHGLGLLMLIPRGPSEEGLRSLGSEGSFAVLARTHEGKIEQVEPAS